MEKELGERRRREVRGRRRRGSVIGPLREVDLTVMVRGSRELELGLILMLTLPKIITLILMAIVIISRLGVSTGILDKKIGLEFEVNWLFQFASGFV
jgi:hypothetical protein